MQTQLQNWLAERRQQGLYRQHTIVDSPAGTECSVAGKSVLNFCSNDYLGLANHPKVAAAFTQGIERWGSGSGAAHLISGHTRAHHELEAELAEFVGCERALLFSTGYMANLGVATALLGSRDILLADRLNHASLLDAARISQAKLVRYQHADPTSLEHQLQRQPARQRLVATDGVFSMDGTIAPLPELLQVCEQHDAWLLVDDAHGLGVLTPSGRGSLAWHKLKAVPILMGTLGKAFGTFGAFVAGSNDLIEVLIQRARTYIYTTAIPAAVAEATRASLQLIQTETWRRERLSELVRRFRATASAMEWPVMASTTPIQPILIGDAERATAISQALFASGVWVTAIRPPTVPTNTARLRITFSAEHTDQHLQRLLDVLAENLG